MTGMRTTTLFTAGAILALTAPLLGGGPAAADDPEWPDETDGVTVFDKGTNGFECYRIPAIVTALPFYRRTA